MGQILRLGKSGQVYQAQIAGNTPTAQELEKFKNLVAQRGDILQISEQEIEEVTNPPGTAFGRGLSMGVDQTQMMFGRALQSVGENIGFKGLEEYGEEVVAHNEAELQDVAQYATRLEDVSGISSGLTYVGETLGQGIATLVPTAVGAGAAAVAAPALGLAGTGATILSASAGAALNYPVLFGENLLEQDQSVAEGILPHVDDGAAALFALPATFLDTLGDRIVLGLGGKIAKPLLTKKAFVGAKNISGVAGESIKKEIAKRAGAGAFKGAIAEMPTEIGQTILTRIQAGKPIDSEEAYKEYLEVGVAAGIVGGTVRGTIDSVKRDKEDTVAQTQLKQDQKEDKVPTAAKIAQQEEYDLQSNRATNLEEIDDPQIGVIEQQSIPFNDENIPPESRASVISGIKEEVATNFSPVKIAHLKKNEQKKVRDTRKERGDPEPGRDIELPEVQEILGKTAANRIARQQKPLTFRGTLDGAPETYFEKPDGFRWSQYEKAVRLSIAQTRNNEGEVVENANVSVQDIMKVSKVNRAGAVAIRKRMVADGVIEEYKRNKYAATADAETKARPLRELEQRVSELQTSVEAAERQIAKEENKIAKFEQSQPEKYKKAISEIEDARSRVAEGQSELDRLAKILKAQRARRKTARSKQGPQLNTDAQNAARTKRDEAIRVTTKFENARQEVETAVKKRIKEIGIDQDLEAVEVVAKLDGPKGFLAQGSYNPSEKIITLATAMHGLDADPQEFEATVMGVANHELLHALFDIGLFTQQEWATLTKAAKTRKFVKVNSDGSTELREYTFYDRAADMYRGRDEATIVEEAIAEMFRMYAGGQLKVVGTTKTLFDRIIDFFKAVMSGFRDTGFASPDDIFASIESGEIASAENRARIRELGAALPVTEAVKESAMEAAREIVTGESPEEDAGIVQATEEGAVDTEINIETAEDFLEAMPARQIPQDGGEIKYSVVRSEFELIPNSVGTPIFGQFVDRDGVAKVIALTNGRHIINGEESGTNHGLAHIEGGGKDAAYVKGSSYPSAKDAMDAMMRQLDQQGGVPIRIPVLQRGNERTINEIKLKKINGVIQVTQKVRARSPVYPTESFTTELYWFGNNGLNKNLVMRTIMRRAFINEVEDIVNATPKLVVSDPEILASKVNFITTTMPMAYNQARNNLGRAIGTQDMITEAIETGKVENKFKPGDKYSLLPTHPTVTASPEATTQVDNAKGVYLYGKNAEFMSKVLGVPIKAIASTGLFGDIDAKEVTDNLITKLQDAFLPVGQFIDEIRKAGFEVPEMFDTYLMEEQYHNKTGYMLGRARDILFTPILERIKSLPVNPALQASLEAIQGKDGKGFYASLIQIGRKPELALAEAYLFAMHAKERNAYIRQIDERNDSGSGMTDAEADAILNIVGADENARAQLEQISKDVQDVVEATRKMNIETGLEPDRKQELTYEGTQTRVPYPQYQNYVPLKGFLEIDPDKTEAEVAEIRRKTANKYGAKGKEYIAALGRGSYPDNLIASLFNQHERAIDRGQRNLVGQTFLKMIDKTEAVSTTKTVEDFGSVSEVTKTREELAQEIQGNARISEAERQDLLSRIDNILDEGESVSVERGEDYRSVVEGVANVEQKVKTRRVLSKNGYVKTVSSIDKNDPSIMTVKVNGEEVQINVLDPRIAKALKGATGLGPDNSMFLVKAMTSVNRYLSSINTSYNPEFFVTNFLRDISTGLTNINATEIAGITKAVLKELPSTVIKLRGIIRAGETNELSQVYQEFLEDGGQSALNMIDSLEQKLGNMDEILGTADDPKLVSQFKKGVNRLTDTPLAKLVENYNNVIENAIRVATYKTLREKGFTRARAGQAARNVTVNFSKGGDQKVLMNSLYLFYNASIQGSFALMSAAVRSKKVRAIWMGAVVAGFLQDQLLALMSEDDEDGQKMVDKIPDHVLEHNFVIKLNGLGGREYLSIPMPYGLNFAVNMGRSLSRRGRGGYTNGQFTNSFFGTFVDAVNPIGGTESLGNFLSPTVTDPFVDLYENKDFANKPVYKEGSPFGIQKPDSQLYWSTTSPVFKNTADFLNTATGGSPAKSGLIDWSPDVMEYWYGFLTGGVGRFVERSGRFAFNTVDDPASLFSEEGLRQIPFTRKLIGSISTREDTTRFIEGREQILQIEADLKDAITRKDKNRIEYIRSQYQKELKLLGRMKATNNARNRLIRKKAQIAKNPRIPDVTKRKMLDKIDEQLQRATQRGNMVVSELYR